MFCRLGNIFENWATQKVQNKEDHYFRQNIKQSIELHENL